MAEDLKKIKIKDLPNSETIDDSDLFPNTDTLETRNVTADVIAEYVSQNKHVTDTYINQNKIGVANGVAPLNGNKKINGDYITYGTTANTAYQGSAGKTLETNLDNHLLDENAHGLGNVDNTSDMDKPVSTAQQTAIDDALNQSKDYTDARFDAIVGEGASETLDTIGEISKEIEEHQTVIDAINAAIGNKVDKVSGKGLSTNDYTTEEKTKLSGIATGAEVNQNAFSNIVVGSTTIAADTKTDSLTLDGSNVTLTPDSTNDKVTIGITKENVVAALGYTPPTADTNTHYISKNVVGSSTATSNTTSALTNGNVYLNSVENGAVTSTHKISGSGATTVTTDASGNIVISSTDTNTNTVTTVSTTGSGNAITSLSASNGAITATKGSTFLTAHPTISTSTDTTSTATATHGGTVTMVDSITKDSNGHVTKVNTKTVTLPSDNNTDTKVTNTLATTTKAYVTGTTSATTNTGTQVFDTGVYLDTTAGKLTATTFNGSLTGNATSATRVTVSEGSSDVERNIVVNSISTSGQNLYSVPGVTANYSAGTLTASGGFVGDLNGNADTATTATKVGTSTVGSATQPVYINSGAPTKCTYTLGKSVPSDAVFTDTTYSVATTSSNGLMSSTDKTKLNNTNIAYGTCSTEAATVEKVITISGNTNWALTAGSRITVKFSYTNTASNPTFNVNSTGAKSVWYNTALITTSNLGYAGTANRPMDFVYDGTQYVFVGWSIDSNTTYSNASLGQGYGTCATAEATTAKVVTLSSYSLVTGGIVAVKFTYAVPASATMNINSKGAKSIYYRGVAITDGVIEAGDIATFIYNGSQYHILTVDRQKSNGGGEIISTTEPSGQSEGEYWLLEY